MKDRKIKEQLLLYFLYLTVIPLLVVSLLCFLLSSKIINGKSESYAKESIHSLSHNLDQMLLQIETTSLSIAYNNYVQNLLEKSLTGEKLTRLDAYQLEKNIILTYDYASMRDITVRTESGDLYRVPGSAVGIPESYYPEISSTTESRTKWHHHPDQEVIQLIRDIKSTRDFDKLGTLYISIYSGYIDQMVQNINFDEKGFAFVLDETYTPINLKSMDTAYYQGIQQDMTDSSGSFTRTIDSVNYQYFYTTSENTGWKCVCVISMSDLYAQVTQLGITVTLVVAGISLIAVYISSRLARSFSEKIHTVTDAMKKASDGDFSVQLSEGISKNEFNDLNTGFNYMVHKINSLIHTIYESKLLQKEAEYNALQAQINPHFLYNTLDTICWQAKLNHNDEIFDTTYALASLLRGTMGTKSPFIPVSQEIQYIQDYIQIQRSRFRDKIQASILIQPELNSILIPKLILQPLVENAYVHGLEEKNGQGTLQIKGILNTEEDIAVFVVEDDGIGMSEEQIYTIFHPNPEKKCGFGLSSVHKRIQILFGEDYGLRIFSEPGNGTKIILRIPIKKGDETCIK